MKARHRVALECRPQLHLLAIRHFEALDQSSVIFCALITADHRARSASMNWAIAAALRGRNTGKPIFSSDARNASSFRARSRLAVIFEEMSSGIFAGPAIPYQTLTR